MKNENITKLRWLGVLRHDIEESPIIFTYFCLQTITGCSIWKIVRKKWMQGQKQIYLHFNNCIIYFFFNFSLTAWPLIRDVFFYSVSLILLVVFFIDNKIMWWEALILFIWYFCYVGFMKWNEPAEDALRKLFGLPECVSCKLHFKTILRYIFSKLQF